MFPGESYGVAVSVAPLHPSCPEWIPAQEIDRPAVPDAELAGPVDDPPPFRVEIRRGRRARRRSRPTG